MKQWLWFWLVPFLLSGNEPVRITGKFLSGWGVRTLQGIVVPAHVLLGNDCWVCPLGEPETLLLDAERDLICLQKTDYPAFTGKIQFPPGELPCGKISAVTGNMVFLYGLDTRPGDSGKPLLDRSGNLYGIILGRTIRENGIETAAARLDVPVKGECVSAGEFRRWNRNTARLRHILEKLQQENGRNAAVLLQDLPLENPSSSSLLTKKYRELLLPVLRAGAWLGAAPGGSCGAPTENYTPAKWKQYTSQAAWSTGNHEWGFAGIRSGKDQWQWFSFCTSGPFAGKILRYETPSAPERRQP